MIVFLMDILALILVVTCLVYSLKLYLMLGRSGKTVWLVLAFAYSTFLRSIMVICDVDSFCIPTEVIGGLFFVMYLLFTLAVYGLFAEIRRLYGGWKR